VLKAYSKDMSLDTSERLRVCIEDYPWASFKPDLRKLSFQTWTMLGEAASKCKYIAGVPLKPAVAERLHEVYLVKGVQATTAIEGNVLSEEDVRKVLDKSLVIPDSQDYHVQAVENILFACSVILDHESATSLSIEEINGYNKRVLYNLEVEQGVVPGMIRSHRAVVGGYRAPEAKHCETLMERYCEFFNSFGQSTPDNMDLHFAILKAVLAHLYLVWVHPYGDGNGRTARLLEYKILLEAGVPSPAAHLLSNHYNLTRENYYRQLDIASSTCDVDGFVHYAIKGFVEQLDGQIKYIRDQQLTVAWDSYVHELFDDQTSPTEIRRRHLLLDLTYKAKPVPKKKLRAMTPRLAAEYIDKTERTLSRDLNALVNMGLIEATPKGYRAKPETILAFLPHTLGSKNDDDSLSPIFKGP
jgi:Fic family protein